LISNGGESPVSETVSVSGGERLTNHNIEAIGTVEDELLDAGVEILSDEVVLASSFETIGNLEQSVISSQGGNVSSSSGVGSEEESMSEGIEKIGVKIVGGDGVGVLDDTHVTGVGFKVVEDRVGRDCGDI
jgi:hypothetical protein